MRRLIASTLLLFAVSSADAFARTGGADPVFKVYVEHAGVYELPYERLENSGLNGKMLSASIGLRHFGEPHPVWVEDGGDGVFGPGDRLVFVGDVLRGEYSYFDPHSRFNCYVLDFGDPLPRRGETVDSEPSALGEPAVLLVRHHLEPDRVMVRFRPRGDLPEEEWYWQRLSVADKKAFTQTVVFDGLQRRPETAGAQVNPAEALAESVRSSESEASWVRAQLDAAFDGAVGEPAPIRIRLGLRGWSQPRHRERSALPHHELEVTLNGRSLGNAVWDGVEHYIHEMTVSPAFLVNGDNELSLKVPKRVYPESGDLVVDVVLLNWIEVEYEHEPRVSNAQRRFRLADAETGDPVRIRGDEGEPIDLYLADGARVRGRGDVVAHVPGHTVEFSVLAAGAAAAPDEIVLDRPSDLARTDRQADYIMISHRSLLDGARRLAGFHRSRGLAVEVVDVQDVFDEFNHGIVDPRAIKDFLQYAHDEWRAPAPRFVILIGDASWDFKNAVADDRNYADWTYRPGELRRFVKNGSTRYAEHAELNHRNLVPTSSYTTLEGHAASDTWFVCFDDGDDLPDMAIGRIPVVTPEELDGVIEKTIAFASAPPLGPWRRNLLFIANENAGFQRRSDRVAETLSRRGYVPSKIYPRPSEPANEAHTREIIEHFDHGLVAVHFIGHGGRYIWRTGPPDLEKNHDLFTLDHLDELIESRRLPVVLSLTCYSAPFDHPTADSIGEKLIRISGRGAIAVFAASWRNSPSSVMGENLLNELTTPGATIGEAVMRAKRTFNNQVLVQTYNLLGDPAVPVAAPMHTLELAFDVSDGNLVLRTVMPTGMVGGTLLAEWVAVDGKVVRTDRFAVTGTDFELNLGAGVFDGTGEPTGVRVYVWDEAQGIDGIGWLGLTADGIGAARAVPEIEEQTLKGEARESL